jgi:hypothetical protein
LDEYSELLSNQWSSSRCRFCPEFRLALGQRFFYGNTTTYANQPINVITDYALAAATILVLLGLPGVYASRADAFGLLGLAGMALIFTAGVMLGVFGNLIGAMVDPWLATQAPNLANDFGPPPFFAFFNIEELCLVIGSILLAIPLVRGQVSPRWAGITLLVSVVVGAVGFFLFAIPTSLASSLMGEVAPWLLLAALAGLGYQAWSNPVPGAAPAGTRVAATSAA